VHNFFNKKTATAGTILAVALVLTLIFGKGDPITGGVRAVATPFMTLASEMSEFIASSKAYFIETDVYKAENDRLIRENSELKKKEKSAAQFRAENERLLALLDLSEDMDKYETVAARVVSYEPSNWYDTIMINKGTLSGIAVGDIVISPDGVVGKVSEVGANWASVISILDSDNAIGTRVSRTGEIAVTEGDKELSKQKKCKLSFVNSAAQIAVGDSLETSGAAGVYPSGLLIGSVQEISVDTNGVQYAVVEPSVNFDNLFEVLVIKKS